MVGSPVPSRRGASQPPALQFGGRRVLPSPGASPGVSQQGPGLNRHSGKCKVGGYLSPTSGLFQKLSPTPDPQGGAPAWNSSRENPALLASSTRSMDGRLLLSPALDLVEQELIPTCSVLSLDYPFSCTS